MPIAAAVFSPVKRIILGLGEGGIALFPWGGGYCLLFLSRLPRSPPQASFLVILTPLELLFQLAGGEFLNLDALRKKKKKQKGDKLVKVKMTC